MIAFVPSMFPEQATNWRTRYPGLCEHGGSLLGGLQPGPGLELEDATPHRICYLNPVFLALPSNLVPVSIHPCPSNFQ
jgi:hypothetical protein